MFPKSNYNFNVDLLRIIAILSVLIIHLFYPVVSRYDFLGGTSWWFATILYTFSLTCVPIFILISGYLMLDKNESTSKTISRTFKRIAIPLAFWSIIFTIFESRYNYHLKMTFSKIISIYLSGNIYHLYFLSILLGLYINSIWLKPFLSKSDKLEKKPLLIISWIIGVGTYFIYYLNLVNNSSQSIFTWWLPFLGFFLTGYLVKNLNLENIKLSKLIVIFVTWWIFTIIMNFEGVDMLRWNFANLWRDGIYYFNSYLSPNIIIMSLILFVIFLKKIIFKPKKWLQKIIQEVSSASFGVYLIHPLVIRYIDIRYRYAIEFVESSLWPFLIQRTLIVMIFSFTISIILRKIPYLNILLGEKSSKS